ncbi:MAG: tripartite tricarboxylate transporter substrate binding protein [Betaproteobacteria bacterium]|nr:tripartite tricarboxylate transporter substrate binding protein [Betaproteobacteria bacterium]
MRPFLKLAIATSLALCANGNSLAQNFAAKAITVVNTQAAGGPTDVTMRYIAQKMADNVGQSVLLESRPGGGGSVAAVYVKNSAPDGYTLLLGSVATFAVNVSLIAKLPYDPVKDFAPVTMLWSSPTMLMVAANSPARTVAELIAMAKKAPDALSYASSGFGTTGHLGGAMLAAAAGSSMVHVPYKGSNDIMNDLMSGRVDLNIGSYASITPLYRAGKVRLLGAVTLKRNPAVPDLPTLPEMGFPDIHFDSWFGVVAPAKTPSTITQRLRDELVRAAQSPEVVAKFAEQGTFTATSASPAEFGAYIASEIPRLARVVKISGAKAE